MSQEKRKKKRVIRKRIRVALLVIIAAYFIFQMLPVFSISNYKTITVESGKLEDIVSYRAVIIKNESIYKSESNGTVTLYKKEGERIGKGIQVAKIDKSEDHSLSKELEEVNKQIELLKNTSDNKDILEKDKEKIQENLDKVIDELQTRILNGDYNDAYVYKNTLMKNFGKDLIVTGQNNLASQSLEGLINRKNEIIKNIEKWSIVNYSTKGGIISYELDGLEEIFSVSRIDEYKPGDFRIIDEKNSNVTETDNVKYGEPVYKIIDNYRWYVMTEVDAKEGDKLEEGKISYVKINGDDRKLTARVIKVSKEKDKYLVVFMFTDFFHEYYKERYIDINIIKNTYEGLIIPNKALIEKDGVEGVYIKDISGIVKFRPVKILASNEEHTIVSEGEGISNRQIEIVINGESKKAITIQMFDEVFTNGNKMKEGLIINQPGGI